jgi:pimeloyl-ACP methyl ester carboxylesterase
MLPRLLSLILLLSLSSGGLSGPALALERPPVPVILVYGINETIGTWTDFKDHLEKGGWTLGGHFSIGIDFAAFEGPLKAGDFYILDFWDAQTVTSGNANLSFFEQGQQLGQAVDAVLAVNPGATQVILVGHSMGGLSARSYLQLLNGEHNVASLITFGTPHEGVDVAKLCQFPFDKVCQFIVGNPFSEAVTELRSDSLAIQNLNDLTDHRLPPNVVYTSIIVTGTATPLNLHSGADGDGIVTKKSQNLASVIRDQPTGSPAIDLEHHVKTVHIPTKSCAVVVTVGPLQGSLHVETHTCEASNPEVWREILAAVKALHTAAPSNRGLIVYDSFQLPSIDQAKWSPSEEVITPTFIRAIQNGKLVLEEDIPLSPPGVENGVFIEQLAGLRAIRVGVKLTKVEPPPPGAVHPNFARLVFALYNDGSLDGGRAGDVIADIGIGILPGSSQVSGFFQVFRCDDPVCRVAGAGRFGTFGPLAKPAGNHTMSISWDGAGTITYAIDGQTATLDPTQLAPIVGPPLSGYTGLTVVAVSGLVGAEFDNVFVGRH